MIFEAYYEIAAFVIYKKTNTRWNKLLLRRNACLGYIDVSQMFFLCCTPKNLEIWAITVPAQRKKNNIWFYSQLQINKSSAPSWLYQFEC